MKIISLEEKHFQEEVLDSQTTVLVDFYADWCHNCEEFAAVMEAVAEEITDVKICMLNTSRAEELSRRYNMISDLSDKSQSKTQYVVCRNCQRR